MLQTTGLKEVILYVQDMNGMVRFYRDILGLNIKYPNNVKDYAKEHWVTFWTGECTLALHAGGNGRQGEDSPRLVFGVSDIEHARSFLCQKNVRMGEVRHLSSGIMICDGVDPEGNPFSLEYEERVLDVSTQSIE